VVDFRFPYFSFPWPVKSVRYFTGQLFSMSAFFVVGLPELAPPKLAAVFDWSMISVFEIAVF